MAKNQKSLRISDEGEQLLQALIKKTGLNQTGVFETAIREMAERRGVSLPDASPKPTGDTGSASE